MKEHLISVIVPVYNVEKYLSECIESILNQSYKNLEIILVNDGSTDNGKEVCTKYCKKDVRISLINQTNQGLSAARNAGIDKCRGEYIMFVDSDDVIHSCLIQTLYEQMLEEGVTLGICSHQSIDENDNVKEQAYHNTYDVLSGKQCLLIKGRKEKVDMTIAWGKLYSRELWENHRFPIGKYHEDEYITYKILDEVSKCVYSHNPYYYYRKRSGSIMGGKKLRQMVDITEAFRERLEYFSIKDDAELYGRAIQKYLTSIASAVIIIEENFSENKEIAQSLQKKFKRIYLENLWNRNLALQDKMKYLLFILNKKIYYKLKVKAEKIDRNI